MRNQIDVVRDIKSAPYRDMFDQEIVPGKMLCFQFDDIQNEQFLGKVQIIDGELCVGEVPIDEIFETTDIVYTAGWIN